MNEDSLKARLREIAVEKNITPDKVWKQLQLERFLARLSTSRYKTKFILKGALLLAQYIPIHRETIDVDFLLRKFDREKIEGAIKEVALVNLDDGFYYQGYSVDELTHPHMEYQGFRISLNVRYAKMKDKIQVDIGIGDVVEPVETQYDVLKYKGKPLFGDEISLLVYPPETILAEKLETIVSKGPITHAIQQTFQKRGTQLKTSLPFGPSDLVILQKNWQAHLRIMGIHRKKVKLPERIEEVIEKMTRLLKTLQRE